MDGAPESPSESPESPSDSPSPDIFPSCEKWVQMFEIRATEIKSKCTWKMENTDMVCVICMEYTDKRSDFENNGISCLICRDGVVCRGCAKRMADTRREGESFNTLRCPACKQASYTYSCLVCKAPTPSIKGMLVKEFIGVDDRIMDVVRNTDTLKEFVTNGDKIMRMLKLQIRVRTSFRRSYAPCMPHLLAIRNAINDAEVIPGLEADASTILEKIKKTTITELEALFPMLCWTHIVGAVCCESVSQSCRSTFTKCDGCEFLVRTVSPHIRLSDSGSMCSHCLKDYGPVKRKADGDPEGVGGSSKRSRH